MGVVNNPCRPRAAHNAMDKKTLRQNLLEQRLNLSDRQLRCDMLQQVMRIWLVGRPDVVIGAYWPIKGEFDPLTKCA